MAYKMRRDHMYIFNGSCGYNPFQFVVLARTEHDARMRLLTTIESDDYHEFQGCYAQSLKDVCGSSDIQFPTQSGDWAQTKDFREFVQSTKVTVKDPTPVMFSSCLDG